jgi:hypothetical protein
VSFYEGVGIGGLKIEESELEVLCTDSTALATSHINHTHTKHFFPLTLLHPKDEGYNPLKCQKTLTQ